jgi:ribonuclease HI
MKRIDEYFKQSSTPNRTFLSKILTPIKQEEKEKEEIEQVETGDLIKEEKLEPIIVFTDGSFVPGKYAGYSVVFPNYQDYNTCNRLGGKLTNNRAEYEGMIKAMEIADIIDDTFKREIMVCTDSELLVNTVSKWMTGWKQKGWKKADGKPVKNLDLVMKIDELRRKRKVIIRHVRAHTGRTDYYSKWNDVADRLAKSTGQKPFCPENCSVKKLIVSH